MTQIDLQLGGGYVYQWECAILLALNYLLSEPLEYEPELHKLVNNFLGQVQVIHLEGRNQQDDINQSDKTELEDLNLRADKNVVCIQVRSKEEGLWTPSDPLFLKALYGFYKNPDLDEEVSQIRFVFLSNQNFNPNLLKLQKAIKAGVVSQNRETIAVFNQLKKYAAKKGKKASFIQQERFNRLLERLLLVNFLPLNAVKANILSRLRAYGDEKQAYSTLFTEFSKGSICKGGTDVTYENLLNIIKGLFRGHLFDYIQTDSRRLIANHLLNQAESSPLPPLGMTCKAVIRKIEAIIGQQRVLNEEEAFVLLIASSIPHLLHHYSYYTEEAIPREQVVNLATRLWEELNLPKETIHTVVEVASDVSMVANAREGFPVEDTRYNDSYLRKNRIRLRLLAALLHLATYINLDEAVDPTLPYALEKATWSERRRWWAQAYVRGVSVESQRIQLNFQLPDEREAEYITILVNPLNEEIERLINLYDSVLFAAGINLKCLPAQIKKGDIPTIPDDEWNRLKKESETAHARKVKDRLQQDAVRTQHLHELLVKVELGQAEQMRVEGRHLDAAEALARAGALLARAHEGAQARRYKIEAAEQYLEAGSRIEAAEQYLEAAEVWLNNGGIPELVTRELEQASILSTDLEIPVLQVRVLLTQAWASFATLHDFDAAHHLQQANELLPRITDLTQRAHLLQMLTLQHVTLAMVWEEWDAARAVLDTALLTCPKDAHLERLALLQSLLQFSTERGDWENADQAYIEAQPLLQLVVEPYHHGLLKMHYASSLARRGDLENAYGMYSEAIQQLDGYADAFTLGLAYQNMQFMLINNGGELFAGFGQHEARRIDLFKNTQPENRGNTNELRAAVELSSNNYRGALQHIRLALAHYWQVGAWGGITSAYQIMATLNASMGKPQEALFSAIRASDLKAAEQYCEVLRAVRDATLFTEVIRNLVAVRAAACEQKVAVKTLGFLADLVPPVLLEQVLNHLIALLQSPENNPQEIQVHRFAAEALGSLVSQLTIKQTDKVIQEVLEQLQQQHYWTVTEAFLKLLNEVFTQSNCQVDHALYEPIAEAMLAFSEDDHLHRLSENVAVHLARTAPTHVRTRVISYLKSHPNSFERLSQLAFLGESITDDELNSKIKGILVAINRKPETVIEGGRKTTKISIGAIRPRMINNFNDVIPPTLNNLVIDGLLEAIINEHNELDLRRDAIGTLSNLPTHMLIERAYEIVDYLLWGAEGTLPRSSLIDLQLQSQTDLLSTFRINTGNIEQVHQSSLHALGQLYLHVGADQKEQITTQITAASRSTNSVVRQGAAMALSGIESNATLPISLPLALVVLLHDPDPGPRSWACLAGGYLLARHLGGPIAEDILARLFYLADTEPVVKVRVGIARGLHEFVKTNWPDMNQRTLILATLDGLSNDISFQVRREVKSLVVI